MYKESSTPLGDGFDFWRTINGQISVDDARLCDLRCIVRSYGLDGRYAFMQKHLYKEACRSVTSDGKHIDKQKLIAAKAASEIWDDIEELQSEFAAECKQAEREAGKGVVSMRVAGNEQTNV